MNIVLAKGIFGFRKFLGDIDYFNGIKEHIESSFGAKVLVTQVDPDDVIEVRGEQLRRQILLALGDSDLLPRTDEESSLVNTLDPSRKTHIIGYSMGGLDARFTISPGNPNNIGDRITSLTTISAPHRGSAIADFLISRLPGQRGSLSDLFLARVLNNIMSNLDVSLDGLRSLTKGEMAKFNQGFPNNPHVRYFSAAGQGRIGGLRTSLILLPAYEFIKRETGQVNDGIVTISSAAWGEFDTNLWPADHADEIGHDLDRLGEAGSFDHLAKYSELVEQIQSI